jgi:hypothetical protein
MHCAAGLLNRTVTDVRSSAQVAPPSARDVVLNDDEATGATGKAVKLASDVGSGVAAPLRASLAR